MTDEVLDQGIVAAQEPQAPTEKMLAQSEVNEIAGKVRAEAFERGKAAALAAQQQGQAQAAQQSAQGSLNEEQVRAMILEQTQQIQAEQARMAMAERVVGEFASKMEAGKGAYEDFEDTVKQVDLSTIPEIVQLANGVGNTHEVMYDLAKNPYKIANLLTLARTSPQLARVEMARLSASIVANQSAQQQVSGIKEPLSQMKASANTAATSATPTLKDLKSAKWLRG
jgi:hypothetical protein